MDRDGVNKYTEAVPEVEFKQTPKDFQKLK
jgi:hypothetical protein